MAKKCKIIRTRKNGLKFQTWVALVKMAKNGKS